MVDFEPRDARDFHGRDGRDGRERRPADHYVGISHPHFDRRMGHYGYMITMTLMLPSAGWIADRIGNKRMYILGWCSSPSDRGSAAAPGAICS